MDIPRALERLGLAGEDWGSDTSTIASTRNGWRGNIPLPADNVIQGALDAIAQEDEAAILESLRWEKIRAIQVEGLRRIQLQEPEWDMFDEVHLIASIWNLFSASSYSAPSDPASATPEQLMAKDIYVHAKSRITAARTATREQLNAYDPATDPGWPDN